LIRSNHWAFSCFKWASFSKSLSLKDGFFFLIDVYEVFYALLARFSSFFGV